MLKIGKKMLVVIPKTQLQQTLSNTEIAALSVSSFSSKFSI